MSLPESSKVLEVTNLLCCY